MGCLSTFGFAYSEDRLLQPPVSDFLTMRWSACILIPTILASFEPSEPRLTPRLEETLRQIYPAPGARWAPIEQSFWPGVTVLRVIAVDDERWSHRPTVALDATGETHLLTDGVFRVPPELPLAEFNALSRSAGLTIDEDNVEPYARFFLTTFLLAVDESCLAAALPTPGKTDRSDEVCSDPRPFRLSCQGKIHIVDTVLIDRATGVVRARRFSITEGGEVAALW